MKIITFDTLPSTNDYLLDLSKKDAKSWTVIHTKKQTNGKGYAGNQWQVNANENLTFSLLIKSNLEYKDLIFLNQWIAGCIYTYLCQLTTNLAIKWPNDIILNNKKIAGVLVENFKSKQIMHSIIGIGININQTDFNQLRSATSLALETDKAYDIMTILADLLDVFVKEFYKIDHRKVQEIQDFYNQHLFRQNIVSTFRIEQDLKQGIIKHVNQKGHLVVEIEGVEKEFMHKQIQLVF